MSVEVRDIKIYYVDDEDMEHPLPYAFYGNSQSKWKFRWDIPEDAVQRSFIFEMRTAYAKDYTVNEVYSDTETVSKQVHRCAYLNSGTINSDVSEYEVFISTTSTGNNIASGGYESIGTWYGACEVRLRIFDNENGRGTEYSTHGVCPSGTYYDFELQGDGITLNPQYRYWGSKNDIYYCCVDPSIDGEPNLQRALITFNESIDNDNDQLQYTLQISDTPLFNEGMKHNEFYELNGLFSDSSKIKIDATFGEINTSDPNIKIHLNYNQLYFFRARATDGFDYSDWCDVNAFKVIKDVAPTCYVISARPYSFVNNVNGTHIVDENGRMTLVGSGTNVNQDKYTLLDRPNGEMNVRIRVDDSDHDYVKAWLMFTIPISSAESKDYGIPINGTSSVSSYNKNTASTFIRAITNESLICIPTNVDIDIVWCSTMGAVMKLSEDGVTYKEVMIDGLMRGLRTEYAYLYLFATDGIFTSNSYPKQIYLDNLGLKPDTTPQMMSEYFYVNGNIGWMFWYLLLPDKSQRMLITRNTALWNEEKTDSQEQQDDYIDGGDDTNESVGCVGYADGQARMKGVVSGVAIGGNVKDDSDGSIKFDTLFELHAGIEDALKLKYLQRTTQKDGFTVYNYNKYTTYYPSSKNVVSKWGDIYIRGDGNYTIYDPQSTDDKYTNPQTINTKGYVSFCPHCNTLSILRTAILLNDGRIFVDDYDDDGKITKSALAKAFWDEKNEICTFNNEPYELIFICDNTLKLIRKKFIEPFSLNALSASPKSYHVFPMGMRYQSNMSSGVYSAVQKDEYAMWRGYNSGTRMYENSVLQQQLMLTREKDFNLLKEQWKEQYMHDHDGEEPKDEDCPYKWVEFTTLKFGSGETNTGGSTETGDNNNTSYNAEVFGLMPEDALLKLNPRPEFGSYLRVVTPDTMYMRERLYNDGAKLNATIDLDYMHDYKKTGGEGGNDLTGETGGGTEESKADPALCRLAGQFPWWVQNRILYKFFEGTNSLEDEKGGYPVIKGGNTGGNQETEDEEDENEEEGANTEGKENAPKDETCLTEYRIVADDDNEESELTTTSTYPKSPIFIKDITVTDYKYLNHLHEQYNTRQKAREGMETEGDDMDETVLQSHMTLIVSRMTLTGNITFPLIIRRGVNDKYKYVVNGEKSYEGSVLKDNVDMLYINFPYDITKENSSEEHESDSNLETYNCAVNEDASSFNEMLKRMFSRNDDIENSDGSHNEQIFDVEMNPFSNSFSYTMKPGMLSTIVNGKGGENVNTLSKSIAFTLYGNPSTHVSDLHDNRYTNFELVNCENNCYETLGIVPYFINQTMTVLPGAYKESNAVKSILRTTRGGTRPQSPYLKDDDAGGASLVSQNTSIDSENSYDDDDEEKKEYYYLERKPSKHKYDVQESPIDNDIEAFEPPKDKKNEENNENNDESNKKTNTILRKPLLKSAEGEPLFTCYKDEVDARGYHFRFTPEDFKKTGKIYIRKYHVEMCNPFPMKGYGPPDENGNPTDGYRNWIVVPIEGKPGRYHKKNVFNTRGIPAIPKEITVEIIENDESKRIQEIGWFKSDDEMLDPFSHDRSSDSSDSSSSGEEDTTTSYKERVYLRKSDYVWRNKTLPKTCVVFDYVDISEAMCKNPFTPAGESPLNHECQINFKGGIYTVLIKNRYGTYVLGAYDLTEQQKMLPNDKDTYTEEFTYVDELTSSTTVMDVELPNNYRPQILDAQLDTIKEEASSIECIDLTKKRKKTSSSSSPYDFDYATKTVNTYNRYKNVWENKIKSIDNYELSQRTVEQFNPGIRGSVAITEKYGYQPLKTLQEYWKEDEDNIYKGKYIPMSSNMVHGIYRDPYIDYRLVGEIMRERYIISDKTFRKVDDTYNKLPFLDYRVVGKVSYNMFSYFSGYPRNEHPKYETRPEPPYPYDRQWRIGGWRMFERDGFKELKEQADETNQILGYDREIADMNPSPGASIGEVSTYSIAQGFLYLQNEWNSYNRLHWSMNTGSDSFLCLFAQKEYNDGSTGPIFSVKTRSGYWNPNMNVVEGSTTLNGVWCIRYDSSLSDMIDMSENVDANGNPLFEEKTMYRFSMKAYSKMGGTASNTSITSITFQISKEAISPATIVKTEYDPWTQLLTIHFRFDDALGRDYDIVGFKYIVDDSITNGNDITYVAMDNFQNPGTGVLIGNLLGLKSNIPTKYNTLYDGMAIIHTVQVNVADLGITSAENMRVVLESDLALNRLGLTLPVFTVKMWANEFLKPIEEQIMSLQGYKSHWKWVESYDESTGTTGEWKYLDVGEPVMGKIQEVQESINEIQEKFEQMYLKLKKYCIESCSINDEISGDIDAFEDWMKSKNKWNYFYYSFCFDKYKLILDEDILIDYNEYVASKSSETDASNAILNINRKWLETREYESVYKSWYNSNRIDLLLEYRDSITSDELDSFNEWIKLPSMTLEQAQIEFAKEYMQSSSGAEEDESISSSSSSSEIEIIRDEAILFIESEGYQRKFISYFTNKNTYADTRFIERALVMSNIFGVATEGVWHAQEVQEHETEYATWLEQDNHLSLSVSDRYQLFLSTVNYNGTSISDIGKSNARSAFLNSSSDNGLSYSMKWQSLNNTIEDYKKLLNNCICEKNMLETEFRRNLIKLGYFCNGFLNNQPYVSSSSSEKEPDRNMCFRWRVETRQYEGKRDLSNADANGAYGNYDERYAMYYHFQMDFFDTFDSQDGLPLNDIIFQHDLGTDDDRILAAIDDADNSAGTTPYDTGGDVSSIYVPPQEDLVVDRTEQEKANRNTKDTSTIKDLRFTATFGIPKSKLPQIGKGIVLPEPWLGSWEDEEPLDEPPEQELIESNNNYKSTYYWRVAPYNIVERPVFDAMLGGIQYDGNEIIIECLFHSDEIDTCGVKNNNIILYYATDRRSATNYDNTFRYSPSYPVWRKNHEMLQPIQPNDGMAPNHQEHQSQYKETNWLNTECEFRGDVQFLTDRPRKIEIESSSSSSEEQEESQNESPEATISFIKDNIDNYDTQWIPFGVERKKPFVIRLKDEYLLFSHKKTADVVNDGNVYARGANVITMSRGFSSDVFGEECMCFPRYTFESIGQYVYEKVGSVKREAVSIENPCVIILPDGVWRMYFNASFYNGSNYYTKVFKADTIDFNEWNDIAPVSMQKSGSNTQLTNYYQPNVHIEILENGSTRFDMYATSIDHDSNIGYTLATIKYLTSSDGINFIYNRELYFGESQMYSTCSPSFIKIDDRNAKLYFTIESRPSENGNIQMVIGSLEGTIDANSNVVWNENWYDDYGSNMLVEKTINENGIIVDGIGKVFCGAFGTVEDNEIKKDYLFNPCVIWDYVNGCRMQRMYYNTVENPYLWENGNLKMIDFVEEVVIKTECLDEYIWSSRMLYSNDILCSYDNGITWESLPQYKSNTPIDGESQIDSEQIRPLFPSSPDGNIKIKFNYYEQSLGAFMMHLVPTANSIRCMAQGMWIGFDNVSNTEALLLPEVNNEIGYSLEKYSPSKWIYENELDEKYNEWRESQSSEFKEKDEEEQALMWIVDTKNYPRYLWWSRKGPGIYRYIGYDILKNYSWQNDLNQIII